MPTSNDKVIGEEKKVKNWIAQRFCHHLYEKRHKCDMLCEHWGGRHEYWDCVRCGKVIYASSNSVRNIYYDEDCPHKETAWKFSLIFGYYNYCKKCEKII